MMSENLKVIMYIRKEKKNDRILPQMPLQNRGMEKGKRGKAIIEKNEKNRAGKD